MSLRPNKILAMAAAIAGVLVGPFTAPAIAAPAQTAAPDIPGCVEAQRATWSDGSAAPWVACHSRSGIIGIEGSTAINSKGTIFMGAAVPDGNGQTGLARSRDGGKSWQRVKLPDVFSHIIGYSRVDPATNRLFYTSGPRFTAADIAAFTGGSVSPGRTIPIAYSDDDGDTWHVTKVGGASNGEPDTYGDLGTIFVGPPPAGVKTDGYPNVIYTCNITPRPSFGPDMQCWRSLDGGKSFKRPNPSQVSFRKADCKPVNWPANAVVKDAILIPSRGVAAPDGTIYVPMSACGQFVVGVSKDAGMTFTWNEIPGVIAYRNKDVLADQEKNLPGCAGSIAGAGCPETFQMYGEERLALDGNGTLYFIWNTSSSNPHRVNMWSSKDGGKTWSAPAAVSLPGTLALYSSIIAKGQGQVGLSYLGQKEGSKDWNGYMAMIENADNPTTRKIATAMVSAPDNPLMPYRCCGSKKRKTPDPALASVKPGSMEAILYNYNLMEHGGLGFAPDGSLWATLFRDMTRDPNDAEAADYEITGAHMVPIKVTRR